MPGEGLRQVKDLLTELRRSPFATGALGLVFVAGLGFVEFVKGYFAKQGELVADRRILPEAPRPEKPVDLAPSRITTSSYRVAVVNTTTAISDEEGLRVTRALQKQVHLDFAPIWGVDAEIAYTRRNSDPPAGSWWLLLEDHPDVVGAIGYHNVNSSGLPQARVFVMTAAEVGWPWSATASHELISLLVNPRAALTVIEESDGGGPVFYAYEVPDACQAETYSIDGIMVSDFVFPAWFESLRQPGTAQFDFLKKINAPLQVLPGGWIALYDPHSQSWQNSFGLERKGPKRDGALQSTTR